jgi:predicted sugar kinase
MKKENWEKEFDKNFSGDVKDIKYFISEAIQQERERIIEKLEKMRKNLPDEISVKIDVEHGFNAIKGLGYNQAIDDIIKSFK